MQDFNYQNYQTPRHKGFFSGFGPVGYTVIVLIIISILYQVVGGVMAIAIGGINIDENIPLLRIVQALAQYIFILIPVIFFAKIQSKELKKTLRIKSPKPLFVLLSFFGILAVQPLLQSILLFQDKVLENLPFISGFYHQLKDIINVFKENTLRLVHAYSLPEFIVVIFVIAITPGICEEMLFRGFVLSNFEKVSRASIAIFLSGFIFAIYHLNPVDLIPLFILGWFLGFVTYYSNSIFTGITAHFFNNFLSAFYLYKFGKEEIDTPGFTNMSIVDNALFGILSLVVFVLILYLYYVYSKRNLITDENK